MHFLAVLACAAILIGLGIVPGQAERRVALVIGNSIYRHAGELTNPKNDAADMAAALKNVGFQVIEGFDLDKTAFDRKVREFAMALAAAEAGLFFYAGHGLQVGGQNYLVPVDAELMTAASLEFEMVRLDIVQRIMEGSTSTNILFLDACRNNPLARNLARALGTRSAEIGRGLAPVESGSGTLISFSTQPGNVALDGAGRNSPFAGSLAKHISESNDDLSALLIAVRNDVIRETQRRQVPWEHSALTQRFFFKVTINVLPPAQPVQPAQPGQQPSEAERNWLLVKETTNRAILEEFIKQYRGTFYAILAQARLEELKNQQTAVSPPEQQPTPPRPQPQVGAVPPSATPAPAIEPERAWAMVKSTKSEAVLEEFIRQFGTTVYGNMARERLEELKRAPAIEPERAWAMVKNTKSEAVLEEFIRQFGTTVYGNMARARLEELKRLSSR